MASSIQERAGKFQLRVTHKLLPKPFFWTFTTQTQAESVRDKLTSMLAKGVVPVELLASPEKSKHDPLMFEVIGSYLKEAPITASDESVLQLARADVVGLRMSDLTFMWADAWVRKLKVERNIAPSTVRKRVGALARCVDWYLNRSGEPGSVNPLRLLPRGYSVATASEAAELKAANKPVKRDIARDRRLTDEELSRIESALAGVKREDRERALPVDPHLALLFHLIIDTGLRLFEAYRLTVGRVDLQRRIIHVDGSKGHRGQIKPRTVPIKPALLERLTPAIEGQDKGSLIFPFWDGTPETRRAVTTRLSSRFATLFDYAKVIDITEHDLRHEATCRWVTLRNRAGGWAFSDLEICRIMGWTDTRMLLRYASLRGEDLADRLI